MDANIFVIGVPSLKGILSKVADALEDEFFIKKIRTSDDADDEYVDDDENDEEEYYDESPNPEDLRFGYGLEVDEPRSCDYTSKSKFLRDHAAYDRFVDAGLECERLGIDKRNSIPVTKCKAVRTRVGDAPPTGIDILGETDWWWERDFRW